MMTLVYWVRSIRGRWSRQVPRVLIPLLASVVGLEAQTLAPLARAYHESPTPARRDALLRFASQHPKAQSGALALVAVGVTEVEQGEYSLAVGHLGAAEDRLLQLGDYVAFYLGRAHLELGEYGAASKRLQFVLGISPSSPLEGEAALLAARAYLESGAPEEAVSVLKEHYPRLPQPSGNLALASAAEAAGVLALAASYAQRVYYGYPTSQQAAQAGETLKRLSETLGPDYPPPAPGAMLERAGKWIEARDYTRALAEYETLVPQLSGAERELAQVRAGEAQYLGGDTQQAYGYLKALSPGAPEADAERLYYLVQCARSLEETSAMLDFVGRLNLLYPASEWRLSALVWAGNYYLMRNEPDSYVPLYRTCYETFPEAPRASDCHWKVTWAAYLQRRDEAAELLREHLKRFPQSEKRPAALYFLGRLSETSASQDAQPFYREILERHPNNYYAQLAAERLGETGTLATARRLDFNPSVESQRRISRSRLLASAGLSDRAEGELRFAARENGQAYILALELARQANSRGAPEQAIRYIKSLFPEYLGTPAEAAPAEMWRFAFSLPFRPQLEKYSKLRRLDLYLLAGLIRQESEFDAKAVSRAGAQGLMQVLPSTGRELSGKLKLGRFRTDMLFGADYNLRLGTYYFRSLMDGYNGSLEAALASYNAGKTRVDAWMSWAAYSEPAEFVETIPFTETRNYVQAILRNAWMYHRIYSPKPAAK